MATTSEFKPVTHIVFDVDGLLIDTEGIFTDIMNAILKPHGHEFTWAVKSKQMGQTMRKAAQVLIDEYNLPITVDEYISQVDAMTTKLFPTARLMPGAERLIRHLAAHNIPMALASGSTKEQYHQKVDTLYQQLFSHFSHAVLSSSDPEVKRGKPAPDCFLIAAQRFPDAPTPDKVLVFEDAPNGVEGALAAGMQVVWVPDANCDTSALSDKATQILQSLEDFKPESFGLPAYS